MPISVAIVEDNADYRNGIAYILRTTKSFEVVGVYATAEDFLDDVDDLQPDVVLMDIGLPGISGTEATAILKQKFPRIQIIILSVYEDDDNIFNAICAGAIGYIAKPVMPQQLLEAIDNAFCGGTPMSPHIARKVIEIFKQIAPPPKADYHLTPRELEVLECLVQGYDYKQIADKLFLSVFTVRAHLRNIYDKLHVHSKSQAVSKVLSERLLPKK
ncbi:MAG: two-component response regulator [Ignavibacteriae bacterium]|nr:MAG: two-component response regulator [Ignavibacteriota bacterium]